MIFNYVYVTIMLLYSFGWIRRLYKRQLRGLQIVYRLSILLFLSIFLISIALILDVFTSELLEIKSNTFFSGIQYNYILPICKQILPDIAYLSVIISFYTISATVVDTTVYDSVDCYVKNYESHPHKITYMCFNILTQGLLLSIGYFSLFITLIKLTTWQAFVWDDSGFLLVISSILAGAMKFPKRTTAKWNDLFLNSYAIFSSIKFMTILGKSAMGYLIEFG